MIDRKKKTSFIISAMILAAFAAGCSDSDKKDNAKNASAEVPSVGAASAEENEVQTVAVSRTSRVNTDGIFSDRDISGEYLDINATITLNGDSASIDGSGASCSGSDITITDEGVYRLTGTLDDGQIIVDSAGKVQLVMDNASISCGSSAPVYVMNADKVFITLAEGSENFLSDGAEYSYAAEGTNEPDAAIFSADSLTFNGSGSLNVTASFNEGITSKDDIVISGGNINITSVGNGIKGKDYVAVCGGNVTINAGGDGLKSSNTEDPSLGFVYVEGGTLDITAQEDGIQAETEFIASGGSFTVNAGGGSDAYTQSHGDNFGMMGIDHGAFGTQESETASASDATPSTKGIKSGTITTISGGDFNINSADDALHSNGYIFITGGEQNLSSGNDGINADLGIDISGCFVTVAESYEGIESAEINISGGSVEVTASDDGFNGSDGTSQGAMGNYSDGVAVNISGGSVYVDAGGDGLDSNGTMTISGGTVIVNGPTNNGNGALDGNSEIVVTGGTLIAAGSSGMAEAPGKSSTQHCVSVTFDSYFDAGTLVTLCSDSGEELLSFSPAKKFDNIIISSPEITSGGSYSVLTGGTSSADQKYGLFASGGYNSDGTDAGSFTADEIISYIGSAGMGMNGGFGGGHPGGGRGNMHHQMEMPTDENGESVMPEDIEIPHGGRIEIPTNANGEFEMPDMPQDGMMIQPPTDENGIPEMPDDMGGYGYPMQ